MGNVENPKCPCQAKISCANVFPATQCYEETLIYVLICGEESAGSLNSSCWQTNSYRSITFLPWLYIPKKWRGKDVFISPVDELCS